MVSVEKRGHKFRQNRGGVCFSDHGFYFHFMPVGNNAVPERMPTPEQRRYMIPNGDAEPCVFIHFPNTNIKTHIIPKILQSPLFRVYHEGQPFNRNHLIPCPMLKILICWYRWCMQPEHTRLMWSLRSRWNIYVRNVKICRGLEAGGINEFSFSESNLTL